MTSVDVPRFLLGLNSDGGGGVNPPGSTGYIDFTTCTLSEASGAVTEDTGWGSFDINAVFQEGVGIVGGTGTTPILAGALATQMNAGGVVVFDVTFQDNGNLNIDFHDVGYNIEYGGGVGYSTSSVDPHDVQAWVRDFGLAGEALTGALSIPGFNRIAFMMIDGSLAVSNNGSAAVTITGKTAWAAHPPTQFGLSFDGLTMLKITAYPSTANLQALSAL